MEPMHKINKVEVRNLQIEDYIQLSQSFKRVYADKDVFWTHEQIETLIRIFPEGQVVTVVDDKIVGCALSIIVDYDMVKGDHTYAKVTGNETFCTHNPEGNILYGIEVFIHPDYRGLRLARRMYEYRKELCEKLNLKAIMFGGRIPNYYKYADTMRPKEYLDKVRSREIYDPVLTFQLSNDFHVRRVMKNYLPNDEESKHCATLLQWDNIYYQEPTQDYVDKKTTVRVGLVQWQMRPYKTLDDVFEQVEFFVDAVSDYKSDFVLFPEYFNAPLMAKFNHLGEAQSIRGLAQYTEEVRDRFINLAISYNINIITGSMPYVKEDGGLYNVGFLVRRDGSYEMYEKVHVTPDEIKSWGLSGGKMVQTFDTDCAKIGILICYDVEFPELSRIMADLIGHLLPGGVQLGGQLVIRDSQNLGGQHGSIFCAVDSHGGYRDTAGHLDGSQQGVQSVHGAALHGDADDGKGGVAREGTGQVGGHARGTDQHAKAIGPGGPGKFRGGGRGAVGAENVGLKGNAELLQLGTGTLYYRPVAIRAHDHSHFFAHRCSLLSDGPIQSP